jgi:hypothetical protein
MSCNITRDTGDKRESQYIIISSSSSSSIIVVVVGAVDILLPPARSRGLPKDMMHLKSKKFYYYYSNRRSHAPITQQQKRTSALGWRYLYILFFTSLRICSSTSTSITIKWFPIKI